MLLAAAATILVVGVGVLRVSAPPAERIASAFWRLRSHASWMGQAVTAGPLRGALTGVHPPGGVQSGQPPKGWTLLEVEATIVNSTDSTIPADYAACDLSLVGTDGKPKKRWDGGGGYVATDPTSKIQESTTTLGPRAELLVSRVFLVRPVEGEMRVIYKLDPGYPTMEWRIPVW